MYIVNENEYFFSEIVFIKINYLDNYEKNSTKVFFNVVLHLSVPGR